MDRPQPLPLPARREFMTSELSLRGLRCAAAVYPAGMRLVEHVHAHATMTVVAGGGLVELGPRGRRAAACEAGALVVRPAGEPHANHVGGGGVVNLELDIGAELLADHGASVARAATLRHPVIAGLGRRLRLELAARDAARSLLVEGLALEIIALAVEPPGRSPSAGLARAHERIRAEFRGKPSIAALAREAGMHPVSFARAFRARYGCSPGELLRALRVDWAADELARRPERSVAAVAAEAGFCDQSHLARAVAARFGRTPGQLRRRR